ncbi:hypothetical protein F4775DRAFT_126140 [Biscogniauxia sp. FL1348]|nr:hypothetical protein F4775DRAFT_126140 [Biscogniauxia sp. FL1348]
MRHFLFLLPTLTSLPTYLLTTYLALGTEWCGIPLIPPGTDGTLSATSATRPVRLSPRLHAISRYRGSTYTLPGRQRTQAAHHRASSHKDPPPTTTTSLHATPLPFRSPALLYCFLFHPDSSCLCLESTCEFKVSSVSHRPGRRLLTTLLLSACTYTALVPLSSPSVFPQVHISHIYTQKAQLHYAIIPRSTFILLISRLPLNLNLDFIETNVTIYSIDRARVFIARLRNI